MKTFFEGIILVVIISLSVSCNKEAQEIENENINHTQKSLEGDEKLDNDLAKNLNNVQMLWRWEYNEKSNQNEAIINYEFSIDTFSVEKIILLANRIYPRILVENDGMSHDTLFLKINDSEYLTQRMGTTGAEEYMVSLIYSLTELSQIKYVALSFEPGDHMNPGVYSRESWNEN